MVGPIVNVSEVEKSYPSGDEDTPVLRDLNLSVKPGQFFSVVGKSGSGKSTLLNLIAGIDLPDSGTIRVGEQTISNCKESERTRIRRENMGMIFQFFNLVPTLTARENVKFPLDLIGIKNRDRVEDLLGRLGIEHRADRFPSTLSGGEQQRVAIARALVHKPSIILADEPTGNLDYENSETVLELFRKLCTSEEVAVIMATHSHECASVSDRIYELRDGQLKESR